MDTTMQAFKRCIISNTLFFYSISKEPSKMMDDLF